MAKPLPQEIYVVWSDEPELAADGFLDAVDSNPHDWFALPKKKTTFGTYKLVRVEELPPKEEIANATNPKR